MYSKIEAFFFPYFLRQSSFPICTCFGGGRARGLVLLCSNDMSLLCVCQIACLFVFWSGFRFQSQPVGAGCNGGNRGMPPRKEKRSCLTGVSPEKEVAGENGFKAICDIWA